MGETENIDFHEFWIFGTRGNPYLWIRIYQITLLGLVETLTLSGLLLGSWALVRLPPEIMLGSC